jgi:hypothetical protein
MPICGDVARQITNRTLFQESSTLRQAVLKIVSCESSIAQHQRQDTNRFNFINSNADLE